MVISSIKPQKPYSNFPNIPNTAHTYGTGIKNDTRIRERAREQRAAKGQQRVAKK